MLVLRHVRLQLAVATAAGRGEVGFEERNWVAIDGEIDRHIDCWIERKIDINRDIDIDIDS